MFYWFNCLFLIECWLPGKKKSLAVMITLQIGFQLQKYIVNENKEAEQAWVPLMHILAKSPPPESACFHEMFSATEPTRECPQPYEWLLYSHNSYCSSTVPVPHTEPLPRLWRHTDSTEQVLQNSVHSRVEQPKRYTQYRWEYFQ